MPETIKLKDSAHDCYHCGLPLPDPVEFHIELDGQSQALCCAGCHAVAETIISQGMADYYRQRDALPESPREALPTALAELGLFDHPEVQKDFVRSLGEHEREAALILEGITCAACVWLIEHQLQRQPGVQRAEINYATRRATVRWDTRLTQLSPLLQAVQQIGYRAHPFDPARHEQINQQERRTALWRVFVAGFGMMQVMMYAVPTYLASDGDMSADIEGLLRWASLVLTLPVVFYSSWPFFRNAVRDVRLFPSTRRLGMDVPVALGILIAFVASLVSFMAGGREVYFDSVTMFVFFLLSGRYLEMRARQKAVSVAEALARLQPSVAERLDEHDQVHQVAVSELRPGDRIRVRPGQTIPADGRVVVGSSEVDESLLTGEARPIPKQPGDRVTGGATNSGSPLTISVEKIGEGTRLSAILKLMERASGDKPRLVEQADRMAGAFIGIILLLALLGGIGWTLASHWTQGLAIAVAVLVVTCPCALSLATPVTLTIASGVLARHGVLVTRGQAIETLAGITHVIFDKTGTLTTGHIHLKAIRPMGILEKEHCLRLACGLEAASEHPIRRAFDQALAAAQQFPLVISDLKSQTGQGVEGTFQGTTYRLGHAAFVSELTKSNIPAEEAHSDSLIYLGCPDQWLACFILGDTLRPEARQVIQTLQQAGLHVSLLSGDGPQAVQNVADELGINHALSRQTPENKQHELSRLQQQGEVVLMVGDGVNDAPVLAQAHVSMAMGGGTELARAQADLVLLSDQLSGLIDGWQTARRALQLIRQNLAWATFYNAISIPLALVGWVTPWLAGLGMSGSSLWVVINSLRLQKQHGNSPGGQGS